MALLQRNISKLALVAARINARPLSMFNKHSDNERDVKKSVFISQSNDVFANLALENWLYKNFDFTNHHVLLFTKNDPSIVIGRDQNPWLETNATDLNRSQVTLARRSDDGHALYNDSGNLNMTFFTPSDTLRTRYNAEIIARALFRKYAIKTDISSKDHLTVFNKTISAGGYKIGETNGYHRCSLMIDVDKIDLEQALLKKDNDSKTTSSLRTKQPSFINLKDLIPTAKVNEILSTVGWEFMRTFAYSLKDGGEELAQQQRGFQMINPTEKWFPGLTEIKENYETWDWCYGKTPKFSISRSFPVPAHLLSNYEGSCPDLCITMNVEHGRIHDVTLFVPPGLTSSGFSGEAKVITSLKGQKFSQDAMNSLEWYLGVGENSYADDRDKFVTECVRQVMTSL